MSPAPRGQNAKKIALRYLFFTLGLLINSFGISIEIAPDVITVPGEGLVRVLAQATGKDFGRVKLVFSSSSRPRCRCCFSAGCRASASARSCRR